MFFGKKLPSISILLGVIVLSGTLGVPFSWLRLSIIGAFQYELNVAEIAAQSIGLGGLHLSEMNMEAFVTIALVMTLGILSGGNAEDNAGIYDVKGIGWRQCASAGG